MGCIDASDGKKRKIKINKAITQSKNDSNNNIILPKEKNEKEKNIKEEENNKKSLQIFRIKKLYPTFENSSFEKKIKCKYSIIIEGESITTCMKEGESEKLFWELIKNSRSLICCRASPMQKCEIVNFIKNHTKDITLAIGDGGNDVNMIKTRSY